MAVVALATAGPALGCGTVVKITANGPIPKIATVTLFDPVFWTVHGSRSGTLILFAPDVLCSRSIAPTDLDVTGSTGCVLPALGVYPYEVGRFGAGSGKVVVVPPPLAALFRSTVVFGSSAELFGELPTPEAAVECGGSYGFTQPLPEPKRQGTVYARGYGEKAFSSIDTADLIGFHGYFAALVNPTTRTTYQARIGDEATVTTTVEVRPRIGIRMRGRWFAAHADVAHSLAGARVAVQTRRGGSWRTVRRLVLDSTGSVAFRSPPGPGQLRVFMPASEAGPGYVAGFSRAISL